MLPFLKRSKPNIPHTGVIPKHVAIIMDGNGRWAQSRGLPRSMGHRRGAEVLRSIVRAAHTHGIEALTVYGFSTENWKRPTEEVSFLMKLIIEYLARYVEEMHQEGVRVRFIGYLAGLPLEVQEAVYRAEQKTASNQGILLYIALNYGGRNEIVRAVQSVVQEVQAGTLTLADIQESTIERQLDTQDVPDVDLLIRPGGDCRISNFLLWQSAYAELWFTDVLWPEFTPATLEEAIASFQKRNRRFGGLQEVEACCDNE